MVRAKRVCAWCDKYLGEAKGNFDARHPVTHGICPPCRDRLCASTTLPLESLLNRLDVPVVCVDAEGRVRAANQLARGRLHAGDRELDGAKWGDVIDCVNASKPGGCGHTMQCKTCAVRKSVEHTYSTGESLAGVPAFPEIQVGQTVRVMRYRISTEKAGDKVVLRIEDLS